MICLSLGKGSWGGQEKRRNGDPGDTGLGIIKRLLENLLALFPRAAPALTPTSLRPSQSSHLPWAFNQVQNAGGNKLSILSVT